MKSQHSPTATTVDRTRAIDQQPTMTPVMLKKTSLNFLYDNPIGKFLMNEEKYSLWSWFKNPYKQGGVVSLAGEDPNLDQDQLRAQYVRSIPIAKLYKGDLLLQGYFVSPKLLQTLEDFEVRHDDLFIVSYPRSGTTWTEELVSALFSDLDRKHMQKNIHERVVHLEVGRPFGHKEYLKSLKSPRLLGTHLPITHAPRQLRELKSKVIYVIRNPKDQAVSYWHFHQSAKYLGNIKHDWNHFLTLYCNGQLVYGSWFEHVKGWLQAARKYPDKVLVISYEELQVDLLNMTKLIAEFAGKPTGDELIKDIVKHCSFSQMKDNPSVNRQETGVTDLFDQRFMRKGVIGDWKNKFSKEQSEQFDQLMASELSEFDLDIAYTYEQAEDLMNTSPDHRIIHLDQMSNISIGGDDIYDHKTMSEKFESDENAANRLSQSI